MPSYGRYTAPGEKIGESIMAVLDYGRSRVTRLRGHPSPSSAAEARQHAWPRTGREAARTFLVLMGIGVGILTLRFALVLMHGVLH